MKITLPATDKQPVRIMSVQTGYDDILEPQLLQFTREERELITEALSLLSMQTLVPSSEKKMASALYKELEVSSYDREKRYSR